MKYRKFGDRYVLRLDKDDEVIACLTKFCEEENVKLGSVSGIGAADYVKIGLFDTSSKQYNSAVIEEAMEITSLVGNISTMVGITYLHLHINVSDKDMNVRGGHLNECRISATCELTVQKMEGTVERYFDEEIGLNLYKF